MKTTFLRDAPREVRVAAIEKLPELLAALSSEAAKTADEVMKKTAAAKEVASALTKKPR